MHIFVTGGSGLTGPAVVAELLAAGHQVTGLARSKASADRLEALGASAHPGSLDDLDSLSSGAAHADGVIHMAFGGDFADPAELARRDSAAIRALGEPLAGTGKPLVMTSGTFAMAAGAVSTETDAPDPHSTPDSGSPVSGPVWTWPAAACGPSWSGCPPPSTARATTASFPG